MNTRIDPETAAGLEPPAPAGAERNYFKRDLFASIVIIALIAFAMEAWSWVAPVYIMPSVVLTGDEILTILGEDYIHIVTTILRLLFAVAFSLVAGSLIGVVMGIVRPAEPFIKALVVIFTGVPRAVVDAVRDLLVPRHRGTRVLHPRGHPDPVLRAQRL